jgi:large subunit ribosomal protein L15
MGRTEKKRASRTYGRGKKAGRGAGKRGGRGNAGLHKHKYITTVKYDPKHFGRYGFKRPKLPYEKRPKAINVSQVEERLNSFLKSGFASQKKDIIEVDLQSAGIQKLLGSGNIKMALQIKVESATQRAISKVEEAGGSVISQEDTVE